MAAAWSREAFRRAYLETTLPMLGLTDVAEKDCVRSDAHLECRTLLTSPKRT
jgi:ABC-type transporter lipoprotein component MlaA